METSRLENATEFPNVQKKKESWELDQHFETKFSKISKFKFNFSHKWRLYSQASTLQTPL